MLVEKIIAISVLLAFIYWIYRKFFKRSTTIVNTCGNNLFQEGDTINIAGTTMNGKYRVVKVDGEQLTIKSRRRWF